MAAGIHAAAKRGSALALPLLLLSLAVPAAAAVSTRPAIPAEAPHLDAGARLISTGSGHLDSAAALVGAPVVGGQWMLWGGGATLTKPQVRIQVSAWEGGLRAQSGALTSTWDLQLAEIAMEQSYIKGPLLFTGGATTNHGNLFGRLTGPGGTTGVRAPLWGGGVSAGVRWPRETKLGFFVRANYLWLSGQGDWQGDQAGVLGSQRFDLGGPGVTGQVELSF